MGLYTFFVTYEDGTHIGQLRANSPADAFESWLTYFDPTSLSGGRKDLKKELTKTIVDDRPVPVKGVHRTWCWSTLLENKLLLIHFTETAEEIDEATADKSAINQRA